MDQTRALLAKFVAATRKANQLASQDAKFYANLDGAIGDSLTQSAQQLLQMSSRIAQTVADDEELMQVQDYEGFESHWSNFTQALDTLYERTELCLDDLRSERVKNVAGASSAKPVKVAPVIPKIEHVGLAKSSGEGSDSSSVVDPRKNSIIKPQAWFDRPVDNQVSQPFKPLLTTKPHALRPLEQSIVMSANGQAHYPHPYEQEILNQPFPPLVNSPPIESSAWALENFELVETADQLEDMIGHLQAASEIAVDLEHHDYRSYHGFVCLMQISTRDRDWIVDTLKLRSQLVALNVVFTDPHIVKVFHGAFMDIIWLQRDFGVYVVSLFDTYCAARALGLQRHSLAYLLELYANFRASKKYQLADWRQRPLPQELLDYARADTHFLLNIFDQMRNQLVEKDKIETVIQDSRVVAVKRYEIPGYENRRRWSSLVSSYSLTPGQTQVLEALYDWRDAQARAHDESPQYIMTNHFMVALCINMPTDATAILGVATGVTPFIRTSVKDIASLIERSRSQEVSSEEAKPTTSSDNEEMTATQYSHYEKQYKRALKAQQDMFGVARSKVDRLKSTDTVWAGVFVMQRPARGVLRFNVLVASGLEDEKDQDEESQENQVVMDQQVDPEDLEMDQEMDQKMDQENGQKNMQDQSQDQDLHPQDPEEAGYVDLRAVKRKSDVAWDDMEQGLTSKQRRAAKRKKLKQEKARDKQEKSSSETLEKPDQVFDYETAESVLKDQSEKAKGPKGKKKAFNPYGEQKDEIKAAKRGKRGDTAKSVTFKRRGRQ